MPHRVASHYLLAGAVALLLLPSTGARAAHMPDLPMVTLARRAEVVVLARELGHTPVKYARRYGLAVLRTFKGPLVRGARIEVDVPTVYTRYLAGRQPYTQIHADGRRTQHTPKPLAIESVLMFLRRDKSSGRYVPVMSGIKLIRTDDVLRYVQHSNPGPYVLVPQRAELTPRGKSYRLKQLVADLQHALHKAASARPQPNGFGLRPRGQHQPPGH